MGVEELSSTMLFLKRSWQRLLNLSPKQRALLTLLAILLSAVACLTKWVIVPPVVQRVVWNTMSLKEDTTGYQVWLSPPVPVHFGEIVYYWRPREKNMSFKHPQKISTLLSNVEHF